VKGTNIPGGTYKQSVSIFSVLTHTAKYQSNQFKQNGRKSVDGGF
jgi:hypothetical protein